MSEPIGASGQRKWDCFSGIGDEDQRHSVCYDRGSSHTWLPSGKKTWILRITIINEGKCR